MSSQKIYTYNVVCDQCGLTEQVECSSDHFRLKYILGDNQLLGWTEEVLERAGFRGISIVNYFHYCWECSSKRDNE